MIIERTPSDPEIDWEEMKKLDALCEHEFYIGLSTISEAYFALKNNIHFYLQYPISSFYELQSIILLKPSFIILDAPLFFKMDTVKNITDIPIRAIANIASLTNFPRSNGVLGTYIRPEDVNLYEPYIKVIEFQQLESLEQEQALYRIYAKQEGWMGELSLLIKELNYPGDNYLIPSDFTERRLNCGQRCQEGSACHSCYRHLDLANRIQLEEYIKEIKSI